MTTPHISYILRPSLLDDTAFLFALHRSAMYVDRTWGWDDDAQRARFADIYPAAERLDYFAARGGYEKNTSRRQESGEV